MRTGADYRQSLRDGRHVRVKGDGLVDDITTHLATRAMVDEYVVWLPLRRRAGVHVAEHGVGPGRIGMAV
jgi:hypothetical protein